MSRGLNQFGRVAQLGEHLLCKQGVRGSNPLTSTIHLPAIQSLTTRFGELPSLFSPHRSKNVVLYLDLDRLVRWLVQCPHEHAVGRFELAEGMFAVNGKMASNPLKARHLATDCVTLEMGKLFREAQAEVKLSVDILD